MILKKVFEETVNKSKFNLFKLRFKKSLVHPLSQMKITSYRFLQIFPWKQHLLGTKRDRTNIGEADPYYKENIVCFSLGFSMLTVEYLFVKRRGSFFISLFLIHLISGIMCILIYPNSWQAIIWGFSD